MGEVPVIERIRSGGFLPLQLTIDPLQKILLDMMEMIKDHDTKIINLENNKCDKGDLDKIQNTVDHNKEETDRRLDELEKLINDKNSDLQKQIDELREKADKALNAANEALEKADNLPDFTSGSDNLQNDLEELSKRLTNLENTVKDNNDRLTANDEKLQQSDEKLNEEVDELKKRLEALENNANNDKNSNDDKSNISESAFNDLSDRVNDLDRRVRDLEDRLGNLDQKQLERRLRDIEDKLNDLESNQGRSGNNEESRSHSDSDNNNHSDCAKHADITKLNRRIDDLENELRNAIKEWQSGRRSENGRPRKFEPVEQTEKSNDGEGFAVRPPTERSLPTTTSTNNQKDYDDLRRELEELKKHVEEHDSKINDHGNTLNNHEERITDLEKKFAETNLDDIAEKLKKLQADIDSRPDKDLIERLFEKFRDSLNNIVDMINQKEGGDGKSQIATTDDIKRLEKMIKSITQEFEEAAAARKCTKCLSCGMGYRTVAGALQDAEQASILGAAPISQVVDGTRKPCFVYGSDHELYYSDSPRGRSFVASARSSCPTKPAK